MGDRCPNCGSDNLVLYQEEEKSLFNEEAIRIRVECPSCGVAGPYASDPKQAEAAWNELFYGEYYE